jgi:tagatose-1,6-bisphosphate aldolase non-catalytic subunit AgaZ/GatZ
MKKETIWRRKTEMRSIWESHRWYLKDKLISMDNVTRAMIDEMRLFAVPEDMIAEYLPRMFEELKAEVVAEQTAKYDDGRERRRKRDS